MLKDVIGVLIAIVICVIAGVIGSIFTTPSIPTWYASLNKPPFNPPNWIFGPVWTTLYILMGIAAYLVWRNGIGKKEVKTAVFVFALQLILNSLWSFIFFGQHWMLLAFCEIIILWLAILFTIIKFWPISTAAGLLLLPYIFWVSFASILNFSIWLLNK